jgi:hypothetical protein
VIWLQLLELNQLACMATTPTLVAHTLSGLSFMNLPLLQQRQQVAHGIS